MKICTKCGIEKPLTEFAKRKECGPFGRVSHCKKCVNTYRAKYYKANRERLLAENRKYCKENREKKRRTCKKFYEKHKDEILKKQKEYCKNIQKGYWLQQENIMRIQKIEKNRGFAGEKI